MVTRSRRGRRWLGGAGRGGTPARSSLALTRRSGACCTCCRGSGRARERGADPRDVGHSFGTLPPEAPPPPLAHLPPPPAPPRLPPPAPATTRSAGASACRLWRPRRGPRKPPPAPPPCCRTSAMIRRLLRGRSWPTRWVCCTMTRGGGTGAPTRATAASWIGTMMMWTCDGKKKKRKRQGRRSGAPLMYTPFTHPPRVEG